MTVEFFGVRGFGQIGGANQSKSPAEVEKPGVSFDQAIQKTKEMQAVSQTQDLERAARVEQLREQVNSGSYEPDLNKVASSLLKFLVEEG